GLEAVDPFVGVQHSDLTRRLHRSGQQTRSDRHRTGRRDLECFRVAPATVAEHQQPGPRDRQVREGRGATDQSRAHVGDELVDRYHVVVVNIAGACLVGPYLWRETDTQTHNKYSQQFDIRHLYLLCDVAIEGVRSVIRFATLSIRSSISVSHYLI